MRFENALTECKDGKRITRTDWNGKNQYVYFVKKHRIPVKEWKGDLPLTDHERLVGYVDIQGHFDMVNAQGLRIIGWIPTQTDMASDKWIVLEDPFQEVISQAKRLTYENYFADDDEDDKSDHARNQFPNSADHTD